AVRAGHQPGGVAGAARRPPGRPRAAVADPAGRTGRRASGSGGPMSGEIGRDRYALLYGPTTGDRRRLAATALLVEGRDDPARRATAGDEAVLGGGKVIRESMGQSVATRAEGTPDLVITGAVVLDHWGVVKADIGIQDGRIVALGKAGNPDIMPGVHPDLVIGPSTEI